MATTENNPSKSTPMQACASADPPTLPMPANASPPTHPPQHPLRHPPTPLSQPSSYLSLQVSDDLAFADHAELHIRACLIGIPEAGLRGLVFSKQPPSGWGVSRSNSTFYDKGDPLDVVGGLYERIGATAFLPPSCPDQVLAHEIGHHVTLRLRPQEQRVTIWEMLIRGIMNERSDAECHEMGIRPYSLSSWQDLVADIYSLFYTGEREKWDKLEAWAEKRCYHLRRWLGLPDKNRCSITHPERAFDYPNE